MTVIVNGDSRDMPNGTTLGSLVASLGLGAAACAAEVNKELVPRRSYEAVTLRDGDRVELVSLVGGG